jgi:hypothetical protein
MNVLLDPKIELPDGACAPDPWNHGDGIALRLDAVISKDRRGNPLSRVGDFVWIWTPYTPDERTANLSFYFWKTQANQEVLENALTPPRVALMREMQYLMVLRTYHSEQLLGFRSLVLDLFALRQFALFAEERGYSLREVLQQASLLDAYISNVPSSQCKNVQRWINFLRKLNPISELGFNLAVPKKWNELKRRSNQYSNNVAQTAPLPSRIYLRLISALSSEIDELETHRDRMLSALREGLLLHRDYKATGVRIGSTFGPDLISKHGLGEFLTLKGYSADLNGLSTALTNIQRLCKLQIHTFSGMRDDEAANLPFHCMETVKSGHGRRHSLLVGRTTKLNNARFKRTRWVTTEEQGFRAVRLAQSFATVIYESLGATPDKAEKTKDHFPLFVASGYLPWNNTQSVSTTGRFVPSSTLKIISLSESLKDSLFADIQAQDLDELEAIDPFRDWGSEAEFAIGQRWSLKSHQLRRSLALYANASGLVKTSSLKRQLQHLTSEMTQYYGRGSVFAKNFLSDNPQEYKKHICRQWQDTEHEAQYLAFARDVFNSDEPLCGPGGAFYELKKARGEVLSPEDFKEQLKMGRMSYKAHPLGGCTHQGTCNKQKGLRLTSGICISENCKSLIGKHSKIIQLIPLQRRVVGNLVPGSITFEMEKEELDILVEAEVKWRYPNTLLEQPKAAKHA